MKEDCNLGSFRRRVSYFQRRAGEGGILYYPETCARSQYPGSFTPAGLYTYGASVDDVLPNWDVSEGKPLNWDQPKHYYTTNETFWPEFYKNNTVLLDKELKIPYSKSPFKNRTIHMPTGYHKPSIQSKQIRLDEEKYMNDY
jgi:hypothetical protein